MYIPRAQEKLVKDYSKIFKVVVVTGPRQVGKTTMLKHLIEEDASHGVDRAYVSLDNTSILLSAKEDPALFLQRYKPPVLIDEIQKAPELLPYIKELVDSSDVKGGVWLTGSQPFHLMKEVSESLAGRVGIIEMLGLSNAEIGGFDQVPYSPSPEYYERRVKDAAPLDVSLAYDRILAGSMPGIRGLSDDMRAAAYEAYLDTYIMRGIRDLARVGDELKFRRFMTACAALTSKPVVYAELARAADINEKTAKEWLSLLVSSYVIKIVEPYSNNLIKRLNKQPIMHFLDTGLAAYLTGWTDAKVLESGAMNGQIFETFAFLEVYKSFICSGMHAPLVHFRSNDRKSIDILMEQNGTLYPIEVKKTASPSLKDARNLSALDPVAADDVADALLQFKRNIGTGCILCLTQDTYPVSDRAWAFPVWAV